MSVRPLTTEEREYLALLKGGLDGAVQGALITLGLVALPVGFAAMTVGSRQGGDQVALALAVLILGGFVAAILGYTGKKGRALRRGDLKLRGLLGQDLVGRAAMVVNGRVDAKLDVVPKLPWQKRAPRGAQRRFYLVVGARHFEVTGSRWLSTGIGWPVTIEHAERSGVVLAIDGVRERLPVGEHVVGPSEELA